MGIKLRIEDPASFVELMREMKRAGLLKDIPNEIILDEGIFPLDVPLDISKVLDIVANPVIRKVFGKKMDTTLSTAVLSLIGTQA